MASPEPIGETVTDWSGTDGPGAAAGRTSRRPERRVLIAAGHEVAALLLATAALWSAAAQLRRTPGWRPWAPPLLAAAAITVARAVLVPLSPRPSPTWRRATVWGALALATPTALATMTTIDFSALAACQFLLVAAALAEMPTRRRIVAFLWAVPSAVTIGLLLYGSTLES